MKFVRFIPLLALIASGCGSSPAPQPSASTSTVGAPAPGSPGAAFAPAVAPAPGAAGLSDDQLMLASGLSQSEIDHSKRAVEIGSDLSKAVNSFHRINFTEGSFYIEMGLSKIEFENILADLQKNAPTAPQGLAVSSANQISACQRYLRAIATLDDARFKSDSAIEAAITQAADELAVAKPLALSAVKEAPAFIQSKISLGKAASAPTR